MTNPILQQKQWVFDRWAPRYDWLFPSVFYQAIHQRLLTYVQFSDRPQVLDLGCGTGRLLNRLAAHYPDLQGTGFDLSPEMIRQARRSNRHRPRLIFVQGNGEALPFTEEQFEAVFNTISFLHYPHPERVLTEVRRVLKPEGRFYLADFTPSCLTQPSFRASLPGNIQFYSPQSREQLGAQAGLRCLGHHYLLGPVLLTLFVPDPAFSASV
ncbi:SAM-dependent methyltransferase [Leptolyngbya sp. 'hensonii']|uniref:class I SAM-dependent methyltransferase n=1 Tax=Leptolyngbya sp. 'hensonii' TaxID=1922337 RepID=UPI00094F6488|nr:class I SAM-dependent methyltransferase [Leptolyngbya sp. 'hensonii']OLP15791.1 SAM-dependent methyltransferase [Leptolyngbya sp. 'hensonii']